MLLEIKVPSETIPALIGYKGQKHRDTEARSRTKISFNSESASTSVVKITGNFEDCRLAENLINKAIGHYLAAVMTHSESTEIPGAIHAAYDVQAFLHEVNKNKS